MICICLYVKFYSFGKLQYRVVEDIGAGFHNFFTHIVQSVILKVFESLSNAFYQSKANSTVKHRLNWRTSHHTYLVTFTYT